MKTRLSLSAAVLFAAVLWLAAIRTAAAVALMQGSKEVSGTMIALVMPVRTEPNTRSGSKELAHRGAEVTILAQQDACAWLQVRTSLGNIGWVPGTTVSFEPDCSAIASETSTPASTTAPTGPTVAETSSVTSTSTITLTLTARRANLWVEPDRRSDVAVRIQSGDTLEILGKESEACAWLLVKTADGRQGWLLARYARLGAQCAVVPLACEPVSALARGKSHLDRLEWDEAVDALTCVVSNDPDNAEALYYRGLAHYRLARENPEHYALAIDDLTEASDFDDEFKDRASEIIDRINAEAETELLLETYTDQIRRNPTRAEGYAGRGITYRDRVGDYDSAIADFTNAIKYASASQLDDYYLERSLTYGDSGYYEESIADANHIIRNRSSVRHCTAFSYRGVAHAALGDYEQAEQDLLSARESCGSSYEEQAFVHHHMGLIHDYNGDYQSAIDAYTKAIDFSKSAARDAARVAWNNSVDHQPDSNFDTLIGSIETAIEENRLHEWRDNNSPNEFWDYEEVFDAYIAAYERTVTTYSSRAYAYSNQGEHEQAVDDYSKVIMLDPGAPDVPINYALRGLEFWLLGETEAALSDLSLAINLGHPEIMDIAYSFRGSIYYELGDCNRAREDFEKVLEISHDPEIRADAEEWLEMIEEDPCLRMPIL